MSIVTTLCVLGCDTYAYSASGLTARSMGEPAVSGRLTLPMSDPVFTLEDPDDIAPRGEEQGVASRWSDGGRAEREDHRTWPRPSLKAD